MTVTIDQARAAKAKLRQRLQARSDVVGIGIGRNKASYCLKVNLRGSRLQGLPQVVDGVDVRYETIGTIRPVGSR